MPTLSSFGQHHGRQLFIISRLLRLLTIGLFAPRTPLESLLYTPSYLAYRARAPPYCHQFKNASSIRARFSLTQPTTNTTTPQQKPRIMLTAIGRAAAQQLLMRTAPLIVLRSQPTVRFACRALSTTQWARLPAKAAALNAKTKKTTSTATKKKPAAKKPAAKTATKKAAPKKKAVAKKQPAVKRSKKVLSPEEQARADLRLLKEAALLNQEPKVSAISAWSVYVTQQTKGVSADRNGMGENMVKLAEAFKNLPSYELQVSCAMCRPTIFPRP